MLASSPSSANLSFLHGEGLCELFLFGFAQPFVLWSSSILLASIHSTHDGRAQSFECILKAYSFKFNFLKYMALNERGAELFKRDFRKL